VKIESIKIQGYRQFRDAIALEDLAPISVVHGANNSGKSAVLDALRLGFTLLGDLAVHQWPDRQMEKVHRVRPEDVFSADALDGRAELTLRVALEPAEGAHLAESAGVLGLRDGGTVGLVLMVSRAQEAFRWSSGVKPSLGRSADAAIARLIKRGVPPHREDEASLLALGTESGAERIPQSLLRTLLDAYDAREPREHRLWLRFHDFVLDALRAHTGGSALKPRYDPRTERVTLEVHAPSHTLPVERLGDGVQRVLALAGQVLATRASLVTIESPEAGLDATLQLRLREILQRIVADEGASKQLLLASHSSVFVTALPGYALTSTANGARVERGAAPVRTLED
jgi:predicted ATPase